MRILLFIMLPVLTFGCSSTKTPDQSINCTGENWKEIGLATAKAAKSIRYFDTYIDQCGSLLEAGAKAAYIDGYTLGIIEFCNHENGFQRGLHNRENPNICPSELRANFDKGYKLGLLDFKQKMNEMKRQTQEAENKGDNLANQKPPMTPNDR